MESDYKAALDDICSDLETDRTLDQWLQPHTDTIIRALKLANKVTVEPSEGMVDASGVAYAKKCNEGITLIEFHNELFKAMIQQALKEIEE